MSLSFNSKVIRIEDVPLGDLRGEVISIPPQILVVDDEPLVADTLTAILRRAGLAARAAYNGASALLLAAQTAPDLLITDVSMPQMNGIELAMAMVAAQPACKVILFSGHATRADLVAAINAGHDFPLLTKPMHPTELLRYVWQLLPIQELGVTRDRGSDRLVGTLLSMSPELNRSCA